MSDDEFVRAHWELWHRCDGSYRDYPKDTILLQRTNGRWNDFHTWAEAAEFTRERLEQIRQLESGDIEAVEGQIITACNWITACQEENVEGYACAKAHVETWSRILARLESALGDLKRGMKPAT